MIVLLFIKWVFVPMAAVAVALFLAVSVWGLATDQTVDGAGHEDLGQSWGTLAMLLALFLAGIWSVWVFRSGRRLRGAALTMLVLIIVFLASAESFALVEADYCDREVDRRHGAGVDPGCWTP